MNAPVIEAPVETVGQKMAKARRWLLWKLVSGDGPKPKKVPYYASGKVRSGALDSAEDVAQLVTYDEARQALVAQPALFAGLGFALGPDGTGNCWQGIDFDAFSKHPDLVLLSKQMVGYRETSPSGDGCHWIGYGPSSFDAIAKGPDGVEAYSHGRFFTVTMKDVHDHPLVDLNPTVQKYLVPLREKFKTPAKVPAKGFVPAEQREVCSLEQLQKYLDDIPVNQLGYMDWYRVFAGITHQFHGTPEEQQALAMVDQWSAKDTRPKQYPGTKAIARKWASFGKNPNMMQPGAAITIKTVHEMATNGPAAQARLHARLQALFGKKQEAGEPLTNPFGAMSAAQFMADQREPGWLIKNVLPDFGLGQIYGDSEAGKTFVTIDMVFAVLRGEPWRGRKVKAGNVVYVAAEGRAGVRKRMRAYGQHYGVNVDDQPLIVLTVAPNIMDGDNFLLLAQTLAGMGRIDLLVVDTLAQTMPGANENSSDGMGVAISRYTKLAHALDTMLLLVHHSGKDAEKGQRGWSGQKGAMEVQMEVTANKESGLRAMKITKQKDGETGALYPFKLQVVGMGFDSDGDEITSCVVVPLDAAMQAIPAGKAPADPYEKLGVWEKRIMRHVGPYIAMGMVFEAVEVIQAVVDTVPGPVPGKPDRRKDSVTRAIGSLVDKNYLSIVGTTLQKFDPLTIKPAVPYRDEENKL